MSTLFSCLIPLLLLALFLYARVKGVAVYRAFTEGAADALPFLFKLLGSLCAMTLLIRLIGDGPLPALANKALSIPLSALGLDERLLPLILVRPLSGSAALALVVDLMARYGPDSGVALRACVLMSSGETILYTLTVYTASLPLKRSGALIPVALLIHLVSVLLSLFVCNLFFPAA